MGLEDGAVDGDDEVAAGQRRGGFAGAPWKLARERVEQLQRQRPGEPHHRRSAVGVGAECDLADIRFAGAPDRERDPLRKVAERHLLLELLEHRHRLSADGDDLVAGPQPGPPGGAAGAHRRGPGGHLANAQAEGERGHEDREDHVHDHAGRDDRHPLRHRLRRVTARIPGRMRIGGRFGREITRGRAGPVRLGAGRAGIVVLPEHLHVAPQGERADAVLRLAPLEAAELEPADIEAEIELLTLHPARLGDEEVPQLMDEDHKPEPEHRLEGLQGMAGDPFDPPLPGPGAEQPGPGVPCHRHALAHFTTSCLAQASSRRMSSSDGSA